MAVRAGQKLVVQCAAAAVAGTCDCPTRFAVYGSHRGGAARLELRGASVHDQRNVYASTARPNDNGNGGAIATNGDTRLTILRASFVLNLASDSGGAIITPAAAR